MKKILLVAASILFLVASCTVEKRVYRNGYNVQWHAMNGISKKDKQIEVNSEVEELAAAQVIKAPKVNALTASTYEAKLEETTTSVPQNDVASVEVAPIVLDSKSLANDIKGMAATTIQNSELNKAVKHDSKQQMKTLRKALKTQSKSDDIPLGLLYVLCFIFPFIAVGIVTDWDLTTILINLLWCALCIIPGIIHALIVVGRNSW
ncbi:MAG: hypothetical protein RIS20_167 [Bacteroidota bacterium]|jgi:uncharacterized membrane protein YqaE (UPF0057 family)